MAIPNCCDYLTCKILQSFDSSQCEKRSSYSLEDGRRDPSVDGACDVRVRACCCCECGLIGRVIDPCGRGRRGGDSRGDHEGRGLVADVIWLTGEQKKRCQLAAWAVELYDLVSVFNNTLILY